MDRISSLTFDVLPCEAEGARQPESAKPMKNKGTVRRTERTAAENRSDHRMFTGIIEEIGEIAVIKRDRFLPWLAIRERKIFSDLKLGDSVAVNGVCLTATSISGDIFEADVMAETLRRTNLGGFSNGTRVNLERAMAAGGGSEGHIGSRTYRRYGACVFSRERGKRRMGAVSMPKIKFSGISSKRDPSPSMGSVLRWRKQARLF